MALEPVRAGIDMLENDFVSNALLGQEKNVRIVDDVHNLSVYLESKVQPR